VSVIPKIKTL